MIFFHTEDMQSWDDWLGADKGTHMVMADVHKDALTKQLTSTSTSTSTGTASNILKVV